MAHITDSELVALLERAFTRSRSDNVTNQADVEIATVAATVARALRNTGLMVRMSTNSLSVMRAIAPS